MKINLPELTIPQIKRIYRFPNRWDKEPTPGQILIVKDTKVRKKIWIIITRNNRSSLKKKKRRSDWLTSGFLKTRSQNSILNIEGNFELRMFIYPSCHSNGRVQLKYIVSVIQDHKRLATQKPLLKTVSIWKKALK